MWAVFVLAALPPVMVDAPRGLPCDVERSVLATLVEHGLVVEVRASLRLVLRRSGEALDVQLLSPQRPLGKRVLRPQITDCAVLARTVALLVRSWLSAAVPASTDVSRREAAALSSEDTAARGARDGAPPRAEDSTGRVSEVRVSEVGVSPLAQESSGRRSARVPDGGTPLARDEGATPTDPGFSRASTAAFDAPRDGEAPSLTDGVLAATSDAGPPATPRRVFMALGGGGAFGPLDQPVGQAWLGGDVDVWRGWGAAVDVGFDSTRGAAVAEGRVDATVFWASLMARHLFFAREGSGLAVALGARLQLISAASSGLTTNASTLLPTVGAIAHAEWRQRLVGAFFLLARLGVVARIRSETLVISGYGAALTIPAWNGTAALAVAWALD